MASPSVRSFSSALAWTCRQCRHGSIPRATTSFSPRPRQWAIASPRVSRFSTTSKSPAEVEADVEIKAAPEIKFTYDNGDTSNSNDSPGSPGSDELARIIPVSPSYFTGSPVLNDNAILLQSLVVKYSHLPTVLPENIPKSYWLKLDQYRNRCGERVSASKYAKILKMLKQLNKIHPAFLPDDVDAALKMFYRPGTHKISQAKPGKIDQWGRSLGVGRRKESTARVWIVEGTGDVLVNGRSIALAFPRPHDRESALWALSSTNRMDKYNVFALISGGGVTGQAESMTLALAKALLVHEPALKPILRRAGCVTVDARRVERKKPGRLKARKRPTWVKR